MNGRTSRLDYNWQLCDAKLLVEEVGLNGLVTVNENV